MLLPSRVRRLALALVGIPVAGAALALTTTAAEAAPSYAATASVQNAPQYLGDTAGTVFTFTVRNTGTETTIGAVEIERPSNGWTVTSCGTAPAGWSTQTADPRCRYRSATGSADDIAPGETRQFTIRATTLPGVVDRSGTWRVVVSASNQFDNPNLLLAAAEAGNGLTTTAYTWAVLDAVVTDAPVAAGSACPPSQKKAQTSSKQTIVICGRNHATVPLIPSASWSSLSGTFVAHPGTFSSGLVNANSGPVVVGRWVDATVAPLPGTNRTVVATIGSAVNQTSPVTTLGGYESVNAAPDAVSDAYSVAEDASLAVPAPGVLANDTDPEGQPITAVLDTAPAHAASFSLAADGGFVYVPAPDFAGTDSFTYRADDGIQASALATVTITVTAVNDAPVNTAPASVTTQEDMPFAFVPGALTVADADSGGADVETRLTIARATVTTGTSDVTVTGNGTGDVLVRGAVAAVAAALDGAAVSPAPDVNGTLTLTVHTSDLGHTGSGGALTDTDTVSVVVTAVNDAPSFTRGAASLTVAEDSGAQSVGWATNVSAGPADESGQTLTFDVTNDRPSLFAVAPAIAPDGTLTYTPAADASGTATVTVVLRDDGGTADGGVDSSGPASFTISVDPVNDPPLAVAHAFAVQTNMRRSLSGLLAGASDPHDAAQYTPSFTLESVTPVSCAGCTVSNVASDGSFDFDPPAGRTGTYTLEYTVRDSGFPAPGAVSAPATITLTVSGPVIWFVDPAAGAGGTGRLSGPFSTLPPAVAAATPGDRVFVASGTVSGNVAQQPQGWLVGQGVTGTSFDDVMGITPPAGTIARPAVNGTRPVVQGGVTLADGGVVRGLDLAPASGTTGVAGSGADGVTVGEVSVTSTGAPAVDVHSSQGSTLAFTRVSSTSSPSSGVRLVDVNTTTPGSVTVTGDGSTAGSGGTISGSGNAGVLLQNVGGASLGWLAVSGSAAEGIRASGVTGLEVSDSTVAGSGTHGLSYVNAFGATELDRVTVSGSGRDNARVVNSTGTGTLSVTSSTFRDNNAVTGGNGLLVETTGTAALTFTSTGSSYLRNHTSGLAVFGQSSGATAATVTGSTVVSDGGVGIDLESNGTGPMTFTVDGGTVTGCANCGAPVVVYKATGATGTGANAMAGTIRGLTVSNAGSDNAPGIWVHAEGAGATRIAVTGNTVSNVAHHGILVSAGNGASTMDAVVTGNVVDLSAAAGALQGIQVDSGTLSTDRTSVCADIDGNTVVDPASSDVRVRNRQAGTTFRLPGYAGAATSTSDVTAYLISRNTITDAAAVVGSSPGFAGGGACAMP